MEEREEIQEKKAYIGGKIIQAIRMSEHNFFSEQERPCPEREDREGYKVFYPDGYESWSPKETFETAYRLVTNSEQDLLR